MNVKQRILGTVLGRLAIDMRDRFNILKVALHRKEYAGTTTNDWLATYLVTKLCGPNKRFIDIGAHIGSVISEVSHADPSINIIAVEAMPDKAANLRIKFPSVELHECAVGENNDGEVTFYVYTKLSGYSSLGKPPQSRESDTVEINVAIKKLDDLITYDDIDVIKIDVEGAELGALRGGERIISTCRPVVMFESGPPQHDTLGYTKGGMWDFFTSHQYDLLVPNRIAHHSPGLTKEGYLDSHYYPRQATNYFAVPKERRAEIRERAQKILGITRSPNYKQIL
jgi:FkbM family methyltransferase